MKNVVQDLTSAGIDWQREKWQSGLGSKFIHQGEKNAAKYADEVIVLSKGVQDYFKETYGRETHFIPNGVNRPDVRKAKLIRDNFGLEKDSYILFLGRLVPEKGIRYLVEAFKNVKTDKKLVIAGGSSDTDSFMEECADSADKAGGAYTGNPARTGTQSVDLLFRTGTAGRKAECRKGRARKTSCCTV